MVLAAFDRLRGPIILFRELLYKPLTLFAENNYGADGHLRLGRGIASDWNRTNASVMTAQLVGVAWIGLLNRTRFGDRGGSRAENRQLECARICRRGRSSRLPRVGLRGARNLSDLGPSQREQPTKDEFFQRPTLNVQRPTELRTDCFGVFPLGRWALEVERWALSG